MSEPVEAPAPADTPAALRRRPAPGQRREQILQCLAGMLEDAPAERVTTAALAARLQVSEAALYRHFASKAQMFEALIEFIEGSLFGLIAQIEAQQPSGLVQAARMVQALLAFAERNPGLNRVLTGDALVGENARLRERVQRLFTRFEASVRQSLKVAQQQGGVAPGFDPAERARWLLTYASGSLALRVRGAGAAGADEGALLALLG
ncbi:MAG: nucleoid occlusion factor SlmA [Betaproteobacteria bacterium]|nr:nucleoid occlusion factor SlmA [Betaproteobacteria bacterium]MDE2479854.1 nucleoid occlusion factor SlmA [Betaproteobacteria bacterium]